MTGKPFPRSFWVRDGLLCAGCYPGDRDPTTRDAKLRGLLDCRIRCVLNLMEATEKDHDACSFETYVPRLEELAAERQAVVECLRLPIREATAPTVERMRQILDRIDAWMQAGLPTYVHCWGGHGRTSTVVACYLIRHGSSPRQAIDTLLHWRAELPRNPYPFDRDQEEFVLNWDSDTRWSPAGC
jgi:hypothetical protein